MKLSTFVLQFVSCIPIRLKMQFLRADEKVSKMDAGVTKWGIHNVTVSDLSI